MVEINFVAGKLYDVTKTYNATYTFYGLTGVLTAVFVLVLFRKYFNFLWEIKLNKYELHKLQTSVGMGKEHSIFLVKGNLSSLIWS